MEEEAGRPLPPHHGREGYDGPGPRHLRGRRAQREKGAEVDDMGSVRTRYELRVEALVSKAALASFRIPLTPIAVPRSAVYRFRIPADRDLPDVLARLIERDVQVVEIRRCTEPRRTD